MANSAMAVAKHVILAFCIFLTLLYGACAATMEALIKRLRSLFATTADDDHVEEKASGLDALKAYIKTSFVPENLCPPIFSLVRKSTASSELVLVVKGFKTFLYLIPRMYKQGMESTVLPQVHKTMSIFRKRRQDDNAEVRSLAEQSIATFEANEPASEPVGHGAGWTPPESFTPPPPEIDDVPLVSTDSAQTLTHYTREIQNELEIDDMASTASWDRRVKPKLAMIRGIMKGNGPHEFKTEYNSLITTTLPSLLHTCRDNRTTVSILGCRVIRELAFTTPQECGKHTERIFNEIEYVCHSTRNIVAEQGRITNNVLLAHVPFQAKYFNLISNALTGVKNLNTRESAAIWTLTLLSHGQDHHNSMTPYMPVITATLRKGLNDRELPVKAKMTTAFWVFARLFETEAQKFFIESSERLQVSLMKDKASFTLSEDWISRRSLTAPKASVKNRKEPKIPTSNSTTASTSTSRPATAMSIPRPTSAMSTASSPRSSRALPVRPAPPNRPHTAMGSTTGSIQSAPRRALKSHATSSAVPTSSSTTISSTPATTNSSTTVPVEHQSEDSTTATATTNPPAITNAAVLVATNTSINTTSITPSEDSAAAPATTEPPVVTIATDLAATNTSTTTTSTNHSGDSTATPAAIVPPAAAPEMATPPRSVRKLPSYNAAYKKQTWRPARIRDAKPDEYQLRLERIAIRRARAKVARDLAGNGRARGHSDASTASSGSV